MKFIKAIDITDILIVLGLGMVGYGLSWVSLPLAIGVMGGILLLIGLVGAYRKT